MSFTIVLVMGGVDLSTIEVEIFTLNNTLVEYELASALHIKIAVNLSRATVHLDKLFSVLPDLFFLEPRPLRSRTHASHITSVEQVGLQHEPDSQFGIREGLGEVVARGAAGVIHGYAREKGHAVRFLAGERRVHPFA